MKSFLLFLTTVTGAASLFADSAPIQASNTVTNGVFLKQPTQPITPAVGPNTLDAIVSVDFIWWKRTISNLEYAAPGIQDGVVTNVKQGGNFKGPDFDYQPGFKVALGMTTAHDGWDLIAEYTWLNPGSGTNSISRNNSSGLLETFAPIALKNASSSFKQNFDVIDLMLGRNFFISKFVTLKPEFGWKFAWLKEDYDIVYRHLTDGNIHDVDIDQHTFGTGIRAGLGSLWHFGKHFGLYGDLFFSPLWNWQKVSFYEVEGKTTLVNNADNVQKIIPVIECGLGIDYTTWFNQDTYQFSLRAGWEQQVWIDYTNVGDAGLFSAGNMNIQGLTVKMGLVW